MNADYRIKVGFTRHHKTRKLKKRLGADGVLALIGIWEYAAEFRQDGKLTGMSAEDIELAVDWMRDTPLVSALSDIGFLDGQEGDYRLHDWQEHNPWVADTRERSDAARLSRLFRKHPKAANELKAQGRTGITEDEYHFYDRSTTVLRNAVAPAPVPVPVPSPVPNTGKKGSSKSVSVSVTREDEKKERTPKLKTTLPPEFGLTQAIEAWAQEQGYHDLEHHLASFRDKAQAKGYQYADWDAAFRNAVRDDWAKLRQPIGNTTPRNGASVGQLSRPGQQQVNSIETWLQQPTTIEAEVISSELN